MSRRRLLTLNTSNATATNQPPATWSSPILSEDDWECVDCDLCGSVHRELLFSLAHQAAPNGISSIVRCRSCGLIYISPRPRSERLSAYYPSTANANIGRTRGLFKQAAWNAARRVGMDLFDINLGIPKGNSLLDVGCGYGDLLIYYESRGVNCIGVDFSELATAKGRE